MSTEANGYDFSEKVALITGSSSGMGAAIALALARNGCTRLTITGRDSVALAKVADQIRQACGQSPLQILGDLSTEPHLPELLVSETVAQYDGRLDYLINCAGGMSMEDKFDSERLMEVYDQFMMLNLRSVLALMQHAVPYLEKTGGNILSISGIASVIPVSRN